MNGYFVVGAESSGTRLMTKILIEAGCKGEDTHQQTFDKKPFPKPKQNIIFRRSVPHAGEMPDINNIIQRFRTSNYNPFIIVTVRDWYTIKKSQVKNNHVKNENEALVNLNKIYPYIFNAIQKQNVPHIIVTYESITQRWETINNILDYLDLPKIEKNQIEIYDGNKKWYKFK